MNKLETLLENNANNTNSEILYAHWVYDKKQVSLALSTINNYFPHYSRHDESHSIKIIEIIIKLLGDKCSDLSSTDIWLILQAAYYHDLGMVVTVDKVKEISKKKDFLDHYKNIEKDSNHELNKYSKYFFIKDNAIFIYEREWSFEHEFAMKLIIADYIRKNHSQYSEAPIMNPYQSLGIFSPRNNLIPDRLFRLLFQICESHTQNFEKVMLLPYKENGISDDFCHPRFVSFLLRLGDLLDIDNDRFSSILLKQIDILPNISMINYEKHASITSLLISKDVIDITAECKTPDGYEIITLLFSLIKEEINNQQEKRSSIVPDQSFNYIPSIGRMDVKLTDYELIDGKNKPRFELDEDNIQKLLIGANLYDSPIKAIRELLQNSVDSMLIKAYETHGKNNIDEKNSFNINKHYDFESPENENIQTLLNDYKIIVNISDKKNRR